MKYKGSNLNSRDIATIELLNEIRVYFDEGGAALNALALGGVRAEDYATTSYVDDSIAEMLEMTPELKETIEEITQAIKNNQDIIDTLEDSIAVKANQSDLDDAVSRIATIERNYLSSEGGGIDWLDVEGSLYAAEASFDKLTADSFFLNGHLALNADKTLSLGNGNEMYGNQGGLNIISGGGDNLTLDSRDAIIFSIENKEVCSFNADGMSVYGDLSTNSNIYLEGENGISWNQETIIMIDKSESLQIQATKDIKLTSTYGELKVYGGLCIEQGYYITGYNDLLLVSGGLTTEFIECSSFVSQGFSFGFGNSQFLYMEQSYAQFETNLVINGNVVVKGNIRANGTIASGGKGEEGDSALADLEARVAALESLIN